RALRRAVAAEQPARLFAAPCRTLQRIREPRLCGAGLGSRAPRRAAHPQDRRPPGRARRNRVAGRGLRGRRCAHVGLRRRGSPVDPAGVRRHGILAARDPNPPSQRPPDRRRRHRRTVAFGLFDLTRPSDKRTHLGRLFETGQKRGWSGVSTVIERKIYENLSVFLRSTWLLVVIIVLAFVAYLYNRRRDRLR